MAPPGAHPFLVRALKELTVPILAIDLPSGVDADTGKPPLPSRRTLQ